MHILTWTKILTLLLCMFSTCSSAIEIQGVSGEFTVGLGPISLGKVIMTYQCEKETCHYRTKVNGSFMWIDADIDEQGSYVQFDHQLSPLTTHYEEKIGSKHKEYKYDFLSMEIENEKNKKRTKLKEIAYPYTLLLNQLALDLKNGGPKEYYDYLSNQKVKRATVTSYNKTPVKEGTLHRLVAKRKDLTLAFSFIQQGEQLQFEKLEYNAFDMSRKK